MVNKLYLGQNNLINISFLNNNIIKFFNLNNNLIILLDIYKLKIFNKKNINFIIEKNCFIFFNKKYYSIFIKLLQKKLIDLVRGYCLILNVIGLGFTMTIWNNNELRFNIGYNHLIYYKIPEKVIIRSRGRRNLFLFSNSYFILKKVAVEIKNFRKLSVYKLKGIKEKNELYIKKNWKKGSY